MLRIVAIVLSLLLSGIQTAFAAASWASSAGCESVYRERLDINPNYIEHAHSRWQGRLRTVDLYTGDVQTDEFSFAPVDLVFAGLLFEYVDIDKVLVRIRSMLRAEGVLVEARLGVHFFHVEPLWLAYHAQCKTAGRQPVTAEGTAKIHPVLVRALDEHAHVCVETTGASAEILDAYALSESLSLDPDLVLNNERLTDDEIAEAFQNALTAARGRPRQLVGAWVEAFNRADSIAFAAFYAEDAVNHQVAETPVRGRDAIQEMFARGFESATMVCEVENIFEDGE